MMESYPDQTLILEKWPEGDYVMDADVSPALSTNTDYLALILADSDCLLMEPDNVCMTVKG